MKSEKPKKGRPKADPSVQRNEIFKATTEVMLQLGYHKATTLLIAKACGISKNTLYNHFRSKEALFEALMENRMIAANDMLSAAIADTSLDIEKVLKQFGRLVLGQLTSDIAVAMNRACIEAASSQDFGLSEIYFKHGHKPIRKNLKAILERARSSGSIFFDDVDEVYQVLFGLFYGDLHMRRLLGVSPAPDKTEIAEKIEKSVGLFMKLFASKNGKPSNPF